MVWCVCCRGHFLCVLNITKDLLIISKLTKDNNIVVEFKFDSCLVTDMETGFVILKGVVRDGLYHLQPSTNVGLTSFTVSTKSIKQSCCVFNNKITRILLYILRKWIQVCDIGG